MDRARGPLLFSGLIVSKNVTSISRADERSVTTGVFDTFLRVFCVFQLLLRREWRISAIIRVVRIEAKRIFSKVRCRRTQQTKYLSKKKTILFPTLKVALGAEVAYAESEDAESIQLAEDILLEGKQRR